MNRSRVSGEDGFTILELIVSLGLLALMTALIGEGLALAGQAGTILRAADRQDAIGAVRTHLRRSFERAEPAPARMMPGPIASNFVGSSSSVRFVVRADLKLERGGLVEVELGVDDNGAGTTLVETRRSLPGSGGERSARYELLRNVDHLSLRYFGRTSRGATATWSLEWNDSARSPELVEIDLGSETNAAAQAWPALTVSVGGGRRSAD